MKVLLEPELFQPSTEFLRSTDGEEAKRLDKKCAGASSGPTRVQVRT